MKNLNYTMLIFEIICGLACIGLGIYYCFTGSFAQIAVFMLVGAVCVVMGIRTFILLRKNNKDDEDKKK